MKIEILSPSYHRADSATTQDYLPVCTYVVARSEKKAYESAGRRVIAVPNDVQGNVCRVRNYILEHFNPVLILDDDIRRFGRWNKQENLKLDTDEAMEFIEHAFILAKGFRARMWGMNLLPDKAAYREYTPFAFRAVVLGPVQRFTNMDLRYDESLPLKEDYDLSLQVLNKYRRTLRFNMYHYVCDQHTNVGGCATYRTMDRERKQFLLLQKKWGSDIVRIDTQGGQVNQKKLTNWDINPVVRVPITGV
jgi:hypothetical protein